jgi:hypothetical protein
LADKTKLDTNISSQFKIDGKIHKSLGSKLSIQNDLNKFKINKGRKVDWVPLAAIQFSSRVHSPIWSIGFFPDCKLCGFIRVVGLLGSFPTLSRIATTVLSMFFNSLRLHYGVKCDKPKTMRLIFFALGSLIILGISGRK